MWCLLVWGEWLRRTGVPPISRQMGQVGPGYGNSRDGCSTEGRLSCHFFAAFDHAAELFLGRVLVAAFAGFKIIDLLIVDGQSFELNNPEIERLAVVAVCVRVGLPDLSLFEFHSDWKVS